MDNGSTFGMAGVLIGQWRPGATARVRTDGTVATTSASLASYLQGTRLFTLPPPDSQALLNLLSEAEADPPHHKHSDVAELPTRDSSREGASSSSQAETLWPDAPTDRPYNALHAMLSQLRRALRTATHEEALSEVIVRQDGPYTLDPERVSVDLWKAYKSLDAARSGHSNEHRLAALQRIGELYRGNLAEDVTAEWIEAPREALRRHVLDAFSALAHTIDDTDPERALILLERARTLDRYNQTLYEGIARLQVRLGRCG
ncbi:hypothetical protein [Streptomyces violaceusniger]|uniref:AfsR/SARP family transcriptional regulator n=1 Tax=Streptomyces violaceusniger TaxID=68280 RepID=UPI0009C23C45|nr:hypothetical protein [Streptomyces hygroscopicus]AQW56499.1 transcriptional regulator,LysM domain-containing protein [Streptomyces hygroscopicus]